MSRRLELEVIDWLDEAGTGSLRVRAATELGPETFTLVYDHLARTERDHVRVPIFELAEWLLLHWWRLRYEPARDPKDAAWQAAHNLASIGGGTAWPALEIAADGRYVRLHLAREPARDVASIQYRGATAQVPVEAFEQALDSFFDEVSARESALGRSCTLTDLVTELRQERLDSRAALAWRYRALAGRDEADAAWDARVAAFAQDFGGPTAEECLAAGVDDFEAELSSLRCSKLEIDLGWVERLGWRPVLDSERLPWVTGEHAARRFRASVRDWETELLGDRRLVADPPNSIAMVRGALREGRTYRFTARSPHRRPARFELARVLACALLHRHERLLPVTDARTATQKYERAFAAELLCPWDELDRFSDQHGVSDDAISDAADHFDVSERLVLSKLVNKRKIPRERLEAPWE